MEVFLQALAIFLAILAGNQGPGLARRFSWPLGHQPVWTRVFGPNKTLAAYYAGPLLSTAVVLASVTVANHLPPNWWYVGPALGLGAVLGDHIKSAIKHSRLIGKKP